MSVLSFPLHFIRIALVVFACLSGSLTTFAQEKPKRPESPAREEKEKIEEQEGTIRVNTELVSIDVAVSDSAGMKNAPTLAAEEFVVYENGMRQQISNFSATEVPFNVVLLIDTSGSTREDLAIIRRAAARFLSELRPQDRVAVVVFHEQVELLEDLTSDRAKIEQALEKLPSGTGSAVYDAIQLSLDEVFKKVQGRKAVIALTDGVDSFGFHTYQDLLPEVERSRATLYFLEVNTEAFTEAGLLRECYDDTHFEFSEKQLKKYYTEAHAKSGEQRILFNRHCLIPKDERRQMNQHLYESARREMRVMAEKTGGEVYAVKDLKQLEPAYSRIAAELRTQYSIAYYPSNEKHDGSWRKLRVEVRRKGWVAKTRPGYRAPKD
jgi:VWFA-related protein